MHLLNHIVEKESEENGKIHLMDFIKNALYYPDRLPSNSYGKADSVNHTGKEVKTPAGVLMHVKRPTNKVIVITRSYLSLKTKK